MTAPVTTPPSRPPLPPERRRAFLEAVARVIARRVLAGLDALGW